MARLSLARAAVHRVLAELTARWQRARRSALAAALSREAGQEPEAALLALALDQAPEQALRAVFDNSLRLGQGFRRFYRADLTLSDLVRVLPELGSPCLAAAWTHLPEATAYRSDRAPCAAASAHARACDYWREAVNGLVLGLTSGVHHARHESAGNGGTRCVDVLYVHPQSPARFAPIPDQISGGLAALCRTACIFDSSAEIEFLGLGENVLYYTVRSNRTDVGLDLTSVIQRGVKRRFPWLTARDASPRAVFTDEPA
jgi:hypothetical protein